MFSSGNIVNKLFRNSVFLNLLLFDVIVVAYFIYDYDSESFKSRTGIQHFFVYLLILVHFFWILFHNVVLLRKFLLKRKYIPYILLFIPAVVLLTFIQHYIFEHYLFRRDTITAIVLNTLYKTLFWGCLYLAFRYLLDSRNYYQLETLKKEMELQQLKKQLNPHFLFNALNNIYSYTLESNKYGSDLIIKLSELMRFIVEASDKELIPLKEETGFLDNYIIFEKERLGSRCRVNYHCRLRSEHLMIQPLLLFPFIENAFKYGANSISNSSIDVLVNERDGMISLEVANSILNNQVPSTKKGMANSARRLELYYPGRYTLVTENLDNRYRVKLELQLAGSA